MKKLNTILIAIVSLFAVSSCSFFDAKPEDLVLSEDNHTAKANIYADFMGLIALMQDVVDQLVFVTELRGDLMMPTEQAPDKLWEVYNYDMTNAESNEFYDPAPFYRIVMNSNDFLRNTVAYNTKFPGALPTNTYRQMIAGAVCIRTWAYLTIGKLYGGAVYYDYAMIGEIDLSKLKDRWLPLPELVDELIYFMNTGVEDRINGIMRVNIDDIFNVSGVLWRRLSPSPDFLLTELYLWAENYELCAKRAINLITGKGVMDVGTGDDADRFSLANYFMKDKWPDIYNNGTDGHQNRHVNEGITTVVWNGNQGQDNRFMKYFNTTVSNQANEYLLTYTHPRYISHFREPSSGSGGSGGSGGSSSVDDVRYNRTIYNQGGQRVIRKFNQDFNEKFFFLHRAGELHLLLAEALAAMGNFDAADVILNHGTIGCWNGNTALYPVNAPIWNHDKFKNSPGVRGRVDAKKVLSTSFITERDLVELQNVENPSQSLYLEIKEAGPNDPRYPLYERYYDRRRFVLDSLIAVETACELGFEGKRFFTLVRMAMHHNNPDILAVPISMKHNNEDDAAEAKQILRNRDNWFIKYDLMF